MQVDGWPSSFHPGCTRLVSLLIASLRRRRGALAALWGQTGAVVGRPLAGGGIPAGEGGGRRVGIQASRWAGDSQPRRWTHDELWVQNGPDQQHRGTDGNVNVHFKNQEHLNTNRQKHSELSTFEYFYKRMNSVFGFILINIEYWTFQNVFGCLQSETFNKCATKSCTLDL